MGLLQSNRKRVVIVDDSRTIQALLDHTLSARLGWEIVGVAGDGRSAIPMIRRLRPDVVTIDLALPYIDGGQLLQELDVFPAMYKIVISATACASLAVKAGLERAGADACICKKELSRDPGEFCRILSAIVSSPKKLAATPARARIASPSTAASIAGYPIPTDERERLLALATLGLANDDSDHRLDLLTQQLATTTSFAACVITFIDRHTQWIKSGYGMERGSTARAQAMCNYTICGDETFIVHDTLLDSRFAKLDAVRSEPMIRAYVGHPIIAASGVRLGAICLLDTKPHRATVRELTNLRGIARIAAELIEGRSTPAEAAA